ncbi:hypothetical protein [Microbacterium sp.]|jgi:hypothetical protein|uniref:hypothetical protein n=1 Tax=Microbacterium sp. TaxID=51671 RepID=UPI0025E80EF2|nr:hypothetical protein [Microbacterium sp.]MBT9606163.1 hypothetical protein [Microbacterium sp.]
MTTRPRPDDVEAIQDLINRSTLRGIEHHDLGATLTGRREPNEEEPAADLQLELQHRCTSSEFGFRLVGTITTEYGSAHASVAATYDYDGPVPYERPLLGFGNEVAVMTIFPFFREALSSITGRVFGEPILLPVLERGSVGADLDDTEDRPALTG